MENQPQVRIPSPEDVEKAMIQKELATKVEDVNPLDTHAQLFYIFNPRFQSTITFLSKKQLILLMQTLASSPNNKSEDVSKLAKIANNVNLKGIIRVLSSAIEFPLESARLESITSKTEIKFFELLNGLLTNKYFADIKVALENLRTDPKLMLQVEDVIMHTYDKKAFDKRDMAEKNAFAYGNKLLASKFLMMSTTQQEVETQIKEDMEKKNAESESNAQTSE